MGAICAVVASFSGRRVAGLARSAMHIYGGDYPKCIHDWHCGTMLVNTSANFTTAKAMNIPRLVGVKPATDGCQVLNNVILFMDQHWVASLNLAAIACLWKG